MTTYSSFLVGGSTGRANAFATQPRGVQKAQFDIAKFVATDGFVSANLEKLVVIPARTFVNIIAIIPDTTLVLGGTPVFSAGDSGSATQWVNASSNVTAGTSMTLAAASKMYDAADYISVTLSNSTGTVTSGKFTIVYEFIGCDAAPTATATPSV